MVCPVTQVDHKEETSEQKYNGLPYSTARPIHTATGRPVVLGLGLMLGLMVAN